MKKITLLLGLTLCFVLPNTLLAQGMTFERGQLLVQITPEGNIKQVVQDFQTFEGLSTKMKTNKIVSKHLRIWLIEFEKSLNHERLLDAVYQHPHVFEAQKNHTGIEFRLTVPNDPQYGQQWQYNNTGQSGGTPGADIDADLAWNITTGGMTALGDTIVVAIIDDGTNINHPDFGDNIWINYNEIENNGIDDDGNGYIDDYYGWNVQQDNDDIATGGGHGTPVAGIVGAKGNNGIGVSGVNWNVKLMIVKLLTVVESDVIEAYSYVLDNRILYDQTNGQKGAYVVSTNSSWGINQGQPSQSPLWCAFYDSLGVHGILSAGATANANFNIDQVGDLPTACPSEYMIAVTNMNHNDVKVTQAGYGATTIDLGAFGAGTHTLTQNGYGAFGGTSGATPHVAGAIGLMYSVACPGLANLSKVAPDSAARLVRNALFNSTDPNLSLQNITTTGGRLNLNGAVNAVLSACPPSNLCSPPFALSATNIGLNSATLNWNAIIDTITDFNVRYKLVNDTTWTTTLVSDTILTLNISGLLPCSDYEFQVEMDCDTAFSGYSQSIIFQTDGCCEPPSAFYTSSVTDTSATINWNIILAALSYDLRYRKTGDTTWTTIGNIASSTLPLNQLEFCTNYQVEVRTICVGDTTAYSSVFSFSTNCGNCTALSYCSSQGNSVVDEWIQNVTFAGINNTTTQGTGYTDHTDISTSLILGQSYPISLSQGYSGTSYPEYFRVWIDYNQNGTFDTNELAFDAGSTSTAAPVTGIISVPQTALEGATRMRVSMKYNASPTPCETFTFGEVEDYCVNLIDNALPCEVPSNLNTVATTTSNGTVNWSKVPAATSYAVQYRLAGTNTWSNVTVPDTIVTLANLLNCLNYEVQVASNCNNGTSGYSGTYTFSTACICNPPAGLDTAQVNELDVTLSWGNSLNVSHYLLHHREQGSTTWIEDSVATNTFQLTNLSGGTIYEAEVKTVCVDGGSSAYSNTFTFNTDWTVSTNSLINELNQLRIYPNPFNNAFNIDFYLTKNQSIGIEIINISGQVLKRIERQNYVQGNHQITLPAGELSAGMYFVKIISDQGIWGHHLLKQ